MSDPAASDFAPQSEGTGRRGHEDDRPNLRAFLLGAAGFSVSAVLLFFMVWWLMTASWKDNDATTLQPGPPAPPIAVQNAALSARRSVQKQEQEDVEALIEQGKRRVLETEQPREK